MQTSHSRTRSFARPRLVAIASALALCGGAAFADSSASVQITSFTWSVAGGSLAWTGVDAYQTLYDTAADQGGLANYDYHATNGAAIANAFQASTTGSAGAFTYTTSQRTQGDTASTLRSNSGSASTDPNAAAAQSLQSDAFTLVGADTVTFTVGYTISVSATPGNPNQSYAEGVIDFTAGSYLGNSGGSFDIDHYSFDELSGTGTYSGFLTTTVTLTGTDDIGYYSLATDAYANSPSAVPEPSEAGLMLLGLGALGATLRRRRRG